MTAPRPDYSLTTEGDYSARCPRAFCSHLFIDGGGSLNGHPRDYGSQHPHCSQAVVRINPLIRNDKLPSDYLTTSLSPTKEKEKKVGLGKEYAREGSPVDRGRA